jgi:hypothetical protein
MQINGFGGLVRISGGNGTGHVSVVGSTLKNITVRACCRVPSEYPRTAAPVRLLGTADAPTQCRTARAASTRSTQPAYRLGARYSQHIGVLPGYRSRRRDLNDAGLNRKEESSNHSVLVLLSTWWERARDCAGKQGLCLGVR